MKDPLLKDVWLQGNEPSYEELFEKYSRRVLGEDPTTCYLFYLYDKPIGFIQSYLWKDYPDDAVYLGKEASESSSLDIFIGETKLRGLGLGPNIIRTFLEEILFQKNTADACLIVPATSNQRAIRAYEKAGFKRLREVESPKEPEPVTLMYITKEQFSLKKYDFSK